MKTGRLEAFSDGVLAIIITIMVLNLAQPRDSTFTALLADTGPGLLSYLLSFVYVGIYWNNHHHMLQLAERINGKVLWANHGLLFFISFLPFTTAWMNNTQFAHTPVIMYGTELLIVAIMYAVLQAAVVRAHDSNSVLRRAIGRDWKGKLSIGLYAAGILAAVLDPSSAGPGAWIALGTFIFVAALWVIPDRRISRIYQEGEGGAD